MTTIEEWRRLFAHPVYERLFRRVRTRYERLERVGGTVQLTLREEAEREALAGLLGRDLRGMKTVTVSLAELDHILHNSRVGLRLPEFLARYFAEPLVLRSEQERERQARWEAFFCAVQRALASEESRMSAWRKQQVAAWLDGLKRGTAPGSQLLRRLVHEGEDDALNLLTFAVQALARLPDDPGLSMRTPIFAAQLTGDPHALDAGQPLAKLFQAGLKAILDQEQLQQESRESENGPQDVAVLGSSGGKDAVILFPSQAEESLTEEPPVSETQNGDTDDDDWKGISASLYRRRLFRRVGLMDDDISSSVATFGLTLRKQAHERVSDDVHEGKPASESCESALRHPATEFGHLVVLTLRHLEQNWEWDCRRPLYVVENPSVFSAIIDAWEAHRTLPVPQLALLSGQPSVAAIRFLEQWEGQGGIFYYNGDFDWKGMEIACRLRRMFPRSFRPWRFDSVTYSWYSDVQKCPVPLPHQQALRSLIVPWDEKLPEQIAEGGCLYQEQIVADLIRDVLPEKR